MSVADTAVANAWNTTKKLLARSASDGLVVVLVRVHPTVMAKLKNSIGPGVCPLFELDKLEDCTHGKIERDHGSIDLHFSDIVICIHTSD